MLKIRSTLLLCALAVVSFAASPGAHAFQSVVVMPNWVNFGPVPVGSSSLSSVTIINNGDEDINFVNAYSFGDPQFQVMPMCGYLMRGSSCMIQVRYWPNVEGVASGEIQIMAGSSIAMVDLSGQGIKRLGSR